MLAVFEQTLAVTAPVFSMLFLGVALKRLNIIDDTFIQAASNLVFKISLPALLFLSILHADLSTALNPKVLGYFTVATVLGFALAWLWAIWRVPKADRGVYVQGSFRGNNGVVGLALATSLYGDYGLSLGGVLGGLVILLYNSLSVVVLEYYRGGGHVRLGAMLKSMLLNPLMLGVLAAIPFAYFGIKLPAWMDQSGQYLADLALPLALICIGGTLTLTSLKASGLTALSASAMKMLILPFLGTLGAWALGFRGADLGVLFLYFASPTAAASYVMARAAGANHELAAAIIVLTTLAAVVTTNLGLLLLQAYQWI